MKAPLPANENQRLMNLHELEILDTPPDPKFDAIVRMAQRMFDVPTAIVSLVDKDRQWFKAKVGTDLCETHRDVAFCAHAILSSEVMIIEDSFKDPRFVNNPLAIAENGVRFYAGAPLILEDCINLGTLCIKDSKPRSFSKEDASLLKDLANQVVELIKLNSLAKAAIYQSHAIRANAA